MKGGEDPAFLLVIFDNIVVELVNLVQSVPEPTIVHIFLDILPKQYSDMLKHFRTELSVIELVRRPTYTSTVPTCKILPRGH